MLARLLSLCCITLLCSCSTSMQAIVDVTNLFRHASDRQIENIQLDSEYRYLRVSIRGRATLLILGYIDNDPLGPVETWYSGGGKETVRLQNGRFVGGTGLPVEWVSVGLSAQPEWSTVKQAVQISRRRDVMPGYEYGLTDTLTVTPIAAPRSTNFSGKAGDSVLQWFEESSSGKAALPASRYAVQIIGGESKVIYGEQCLNQSLCISWQRWPANS
ncbi:hypothetical protein [Paraburkholderia caffeinilytica]|uniref:hypothetical protein n=1 Tax=Paraburkholderia caffeinilytica TaxID=1761016 RepID=UPI0038B910DC